MIRFYGTIDIPFQVINAADEIKHLNYRTTTPVRFRKNALTPDIAGGLMSTLAEFIGVTVDRLDYVYFSVARGAEPHVDALDPEKFTSHTWVIPVILPKGHTIIHAEHDSMVAKVGGVYEFNHERVHSMHVEDTESGCVVIMVTLKK
jgi:hypothetical protein